MVNLLRPWSQTTPPKYFFFNICPCWANRLIICCFCILIISSYSFMTVMTSSNFDMFSPISSRLGWYSSSLSFINFNNSSFTHLIFFFLLFLAMFWTYNQKHHFQFLVCYNKTWKATNYDKDSSKENKNKQKIPGGVVHFHFSIFLPTMYW